MPIFNEDTLTLTFAGCGVVQDYPYNILFLMTKKNYLSYDDIHDVSVLPRTGSNPVDIDRFPKPYWKDHTIINVLCTA